MNMENMGIIWGPTLFSSPLISADESSVQMRMATALFTNFSSIFGEELRDEPNSNPASLRDVKYLNLAGLSSDDVDLILSQVSSVIGPPAKATESMIGERLLGSMLGELEAASSATSGGPPPTPGPSPVRTGPAAAPARTASPAAGPAPGPANNQAQWTPGPLLPPAFQQFTAQPRPGSGYAVLPNFLEEPPAVDSPSGSRIRATTEYQDMPPPSSQPQSLADSAIEAYLGTRASRVETDANGFTLPDLNAPFLQPQGHQTAQPPPAQAQSTSPLYNSQPNASNPPLYNSQPNASPLYFSQPNVGSSQAQPSQPTTWPEPAAQLVAAAPQETAQPAQPAQPAQQQPAYFPPTDLTSFASTLQALLVRPADPVVAAAFANYYKTQSSQVQVQLEAYNTTQLAALAAHLLGALT